jgi:hypothetical protein
MNEKSLVGHRVCGDAADRAPHLCAKSNYDVGPVWRVTYYHIKPGQSEAFWKDIRENIKPVYADIRVEADLIDKRFTRTANGQPRCADNLQAIWQRCWPSVRDVPTGLRPYLSKSR